MKKVHPNFVGHFGCLFDPGTLGSKGQEILTAPLFRARGVNTKVLGQVTGQSRPKTRQDCELSAVKFTQAKPNQIPCEAKATSKAWDIN